MVKILSEKIKSWIVYGKSAFFEVTYEDENAIFGDPIQTIVVMKEKNGNKWTNIN